MLGTSVITAAAGIIFFRTRHWLKRYPADGGVRCRGCGYELAAGAEQAKGRLHEPPGASAAEQPPEESIDLGPCPECGRSTRDAVSPTVRHGEHRRRRRWLVGLVLAGLASLACEVAAWVAVEPVVHARGRVELTPTEPPGGYQAVVVFDLRAVRAQEARGRALVQLVPAGIPASTVPGRALAWSDGSLWFARDGETAEQSGRPGEQQHERKPIEVSLIPMLAQAGGMSPAEAAAPAATIAGYLRWMTGGGGAFWTAPPGFSAVQTWSRYSRARPWWVWVAGLPVGLTAGGVVLFLGSMRQEHADGRPS